MSFPSPRWSKLNERVSSTFCLAAPAKMNAVFFSSWDENYQFGGGLTANLLFIMATFRRDMNSKGPGKTEILGLEMVLAKSGGSGNVTKSLQFCRPL